MPSLREHTQELPGLEVAIQAVPDKRILLTDPNAQFMTTRDSHAGKPQTTPHLARRQSKADRS